jgi:hypothetical protein
MQSMPMESPALPCSVRAMLGAHVGADKPLQAANRLQSCGPGQGFHFHFLSIARSPSQLSHPSPGQMCARLQERVACSLVSPILLSMCSEAIDARMLFHNRMSSSTSSQDK